MNKAITAEWARNTAEKILGEKAEEQITKCEHAIKSAVSSNESYCTIGLPLEDRAIRELEERGFKLSKNQSDHQMDNSYYEISWK